MDKKIPTDSLTDKQKDYATFLPAMSSFFARDLGKARHEEDTSCLRGFRKTLNMALKV